MRLVTSDDFVVGLLRLVADNVDGVVVRLRYLPTHWQRVDDTLEVAGENDYLKGAIAFFVEKCR